MKYISIIIPKTKYTLVVLCMALAGCVAPSMTIYRQGILKDKDGNKKATAVKALQFYSNTYGKTRIAVDEGSGRSVVIEAEGGIDNSTLAKVNYAGVAQVGRAIVQPIIWGAFTGGTLGAIPGAVK